MQFKKIITSILILISITSLSFANQKLKIVTTYPFIKDIVKQIAGDKAEVLSLAAGYEDPHFVEARPSMVVKLRNADAVVLNGMALDIWIQGLIEASRNNKIIPSSLGYIDLSAGINKLEVPVGKVDASMGHVHVEGNPHYALNPENIEGMIKIIISKLQELDISNADYFKENGDQYLQELSNKITQWKQKLAVYKEQRIITYHASWPYFEEFSGLKVIERVEPKPGVPPTPSHLKKLVDIINKNNVKLLVCEDYFNRKAPIFLKKKTGINLLFLPVDIQKDTAKSYLELWDNNINKIISAFKDGQQ